MARCVLVIEAGPGSIACGAFKAAAPQEMEVNRYSTADLAEALPLLKRDLDSKGLKPAKVLLSLHSALVSARVLEIPIADRRKLRRVIPVQAEGLFLKGLDEMLIDALPLADGRAAFVGIEKELLSRMLQALAEYGMSPCWAGPSMLSKVVALNAIDGGRHTTPALVDDDSITVARGGKLLFFKHLGSTEDLALSLAAMEADGIAVEPFYSAGSSSFARRAGIEAVDAGSGYSETSLLAVAMHHERGLRESVDFLELYTDPGADRKRRARLGVAAGLVAALALSWGAYSYLKYLNLEAEHKLVEAALEKGYSELFPGENPESPEYALEVKLKALADERTALAGRTDVLGAMSELARAAGATGEASGVRIKELQAHAANITVLSEAGSFEEAAGFRESVEKNGILKEVSLTGSKPGPDGRVRFNLSAKAGAQ